MNDTWAPGALYTWTCKCGVRLIASDAVELDRLKAEHADFHIERGEYPW